MAEKASIEAKLEQIAFLEEETEIQSVITEVFLELEALSDIEPSEKKKLQETLTSESLRAFEKELRQMIGEYDLKEYAPELVQLGITTVNNLAYNVYYFEEDLENPSNDKESNIFRIILSKLSKVLETRGTLAQKNVDMFDPWVIRFVQDCPTLQHIRSLTYTQLKEYLRPATANDRITVEGLYAKGSEIRKQIERYGLSLDIAETLEQNGVISASDMEEAVYQNILESIPSDSRSRMKQLYANEHNKPNQKQDHLHWESFRYKLDDAKNIVTEATCDLQQKNNEISDKLQIPNWDILELNNLSSVFTCLNCLDKLTEKPPYQTNEVIVSAASCGLARYGIYTAHSTLTETSKLPTFPILEKPEFVKCHPVTLEIDTKAVVSTRTTFPTAFYNSVQYSGILHALHLAENEFGTRVLNVCQSDIGEVGEHQSTGVGNYASVTQVISIPLKSFHIPREDIHLTNEAQSTGKWVQDLDGARGFIDHFGAHIPVGVQHLGGIYFRILELHTDEETDESILIKAVENQLRLEELSGYKSFREGISNLSTTNTPETVCSINDTGKSVSGRFTFQVKSIGPATKHLGVFRKVLHTSNATWCVIDRGEPDLFLPVWDLLSELGEDYSKPAMLIKTEWDIQKTVANSTDELIFVYKDGDDVVYTEECKVKLQEMRNYIQNQIELEEFQNPNLTFQSLSRILAKIMLTQKDLSIECSAVIEALRMQELILFLNTLVLKPKDEFTAAHALIKRYFDGHKLNRFMMLFAGNTLVESFFESDIITCGNLLSWRLPNTDQEEDSSNNLICITEFCHDRPPVNVISDSFETLIDCLIHREEAFKSTTRNLDKTKHARWKRARDEEETRKPVRSPFLKLLKLQSSCSLSARMELYRQLLDQRYTVPVIVPNSKTGNFSYYIETLRFVYIKLNNRLLGIMDDISLPRVVFLSQRSESESENARMVLAVLQCNVASLNCKDKTGTSVEFGVGFLQDSETAQYNPWLTLYVRGDYAALIPFIVQFSDIIVLELDPVKDSQNTTEDISRAGENKLLLRWKNTNAELDVIDDDNLIVITGNFHGVAEEMGEALFGLNTTSANRKRVPLTEIICPNLQVEEAIIGLKKIEDVVSSFVTEYPKKSLRKSLLLQASFAKESKLRLDMHGCRHDENKLTGLRVSVDTEVNYRRIAATNQRNLEILKLLLKLLGETDSDLRIVGLQQLEVSISHYCDMILKVEKENLNQTWDFYQNNKENTTALKKYFEAKQKYTDNGVGLEHLWRELSHIYSAHPEMYADLPKYAAQCLVDGFSLEIMDGDAGNVNMKWIKDVFLAVDQQLELEFGHKPKVFVLSAMGTQSTGKSTLLNTMFGCRLRTSAGQCTRGVFIQLVKAHRGGFDYVLVMDTEGIRSPEFFGIDNAIWRDNRMATFAVLPADTCLITTVNEEDSAIKEVLPIVMLAFKGSHIAEITAGRMRPLLVFVYSRVDTTQIALNKFQQNRRQMLVDLEEAANKVTGSKIAGDEQLVHNKTSSTQGSLQKYLADFRTNEDEALSDVKYLGLLNKGETPPSDTPNFDYGAKIVKIREYLQTRLEQNNFQGHCLVEWADYLELVLKCINTTDFELNFKTALQYQSYTDLQNRINQARQIVTNAYSKQFDVLETTILDAETMPCKEVIVENLRMEVLSSVTDQSAAVRSLFNDKTFKQFETTEMSQWKHFVEDQRFTWGQLLSSAFECRWKFSLEENKYEAELVKKLRSEWEKNKGSLKDKSMRKNIFHSIFQKQLQLAREEHPPLEVKEKIHEEYSREKQAIVNASWWRTVIPWVKSKIFPQRNTCANETASQLIARIEGILRTVRHFDISVVQQAILWTNEMAAQAKISREDTSKLHKLVHGRLVTNLVTIQVNWESKNNIAKKLEASKERLWNKFERICSGFLGVDAIAGDLVDGLVEAVRYGFRHQLAIDVKTNLHSQSWIGRADIMQAHIDLDLISMIQRGDTDLVMNALHKSREHYKDILHKLIRQCSNEETSWNILVACLEEAVSHASKAAASTPANRAHLFKIELTKKLPSETKMRFPNHVWQDIIQQDSELGKNNWVEVGDVVATKIQKWQKDIILFDTEVEFCELVSDLLELEGQTSGRQRCSASCPICGMICYKYAGHEGELSPIAKQHDCPHQPSGLVGSIWDYSSSSNQGELLAETCTGMVADGRLFKHNGKWVSYKDFCTVYPSWALPNLSQRQELREYIFYNYQTALVRKYPWAKQCSSMPTAYCHNLGTLEKTCKTKIGNNV